jgi:hypothetical protein
LHWLRNGMRNPGVDTVAQLCAAMPESVRADLIDPLCIAALNTPAEQASATVFLRVLADALFGGPGSSDLLLPATGLSNLFPFPAALWLEHQGASVRFGSRVHRIERQASGWLVDDDPFDVVVLACSAVEAARLTAAVNPQWSVQAAALHYEPIATVYLRRDGLPLASPMVALQSSPEEPAQFAFDLELLQHQTALVAFVVSGARQWVDRGLPALSAAVQRQAAKALAASFAGEPLVVHTAMERRATFACLPALSRPSMTVGDGLLVAGDYVDGPYPATIEGAVRAGVRAAAGLMAASGTRVGPVSSIASRMQNVVP